MSDSTFLKVSQPGSVMITESEAIEAMTLPSGSRPRVYAYDGKQILAIRSQYHVDTYGADIEFYWLPGERTISDMIQPA